MLISGKILPLDRSNIDTDQIIPARYLTGITKTGYGVHLLEDVPGTPINNPKYKDAAVLLTKENFGCGSSREHAVWAIMDKGFKAVIASSFARIFEENCYNNGLVPVKLKSEEVEKLFKQSNCEIDVINQVVKLESGEIFKFELDPLKKEFILKGGFLKYMESKVSLVKTWEKTAS
ncbi:MAG: 3-isopropylmalate dehydratase small subunit [Candidatus Melainabacteria bacterium RIFCSPHIGHO2_02_FULL_34_12]|nr:MAG: 3-isopropylmalate dehydratase small subunit [Candidatus Melainabacteria bacterium RIFCSPHIGHO2_02_FULL_34_12]